MTVYLDLLFGLNTVINYLLLRGSAAMGGCPAGVWRLLGAAALGGLYAVVSVLPGLEPMQGLFFQILSASGMLIAAFGWKRSTVKQGVLFFALSFALSGVVLLVVQVIEPKCVFLGGHVYYAVSIPALLLLAGFSYGLAALVLGGFGSHSGGDIVPLILELNGNREKVKALQDTGNTLRDSISGECIPVASWQVLARLLPEAALTQKDFQDPPTLMQLLQRTYPQLRFRLLPYGAVGTQNGLLVAVRCKIQQGRRTGRLPVAFTGTEFSPHGQFEILLGGVAS